MLISSILSHLLTEKNTGNARSLTCKRPSSDLASVTHRLGMPGLLSAFSNSSRAPGFFFSFLTNDSTARSAHFSSSSPCFQPSSRFTAGLVNANKLLSPLTGDDMFNCQTDIFVLQHNHTQPTQSIHYENTDSSNIATALLYGIEEFAPSVYVLRAALVVLTTTTIDWWRSLSIYLPIIHKVCSATDAVKHRMTDH